MTPEEKIAHLEKTLLKVEKELAYKTKVLGSYSAVVNAMPGHMKVAVANAAVKAYHGAAPEELGALMTEEGLAATKAKLAAPKVYWMVAGHGFKDPEAGWPMTKSSVCSHCGGAIEVGEAYADVKVSLGETLFLHGGCVEEGVPGSVA
jgi:hypothetical protein